VIYYRGVGCLLISQPKGVEETTQIGMSLRRIERDTLRSPAHLLVNGGLRATKLFGSGVATDGMEIISGKTTRGGDNFGIKDADLLDVWPHA